MKTPMLIIALLLSVTVCAQEPRATASDALLQTCLLGTGTHTWTTLKLTRDQLVRVQRVQEACKEECDAAGVPVVDNPLSSANGNTIISELKGILTSEQYQGWVAYCTSSGKSMKPSN
ncbi:MAG: hypothetical protein IPM46_14295 [Flavobacteriales bacterium]|nr:hypothetical protein [Flavobacteriales bacterium]